MTKITLTYYAHNLSAGHTIADDIRMMVDYIQKNPDGTDSTFTFCGNEIDPRWVKNPSPNLIPGYIKCPICLALRNCDGRWTPIT